MNIEIKVMVIIGIVVLAIGIILFLCCVIYESFKCIFKDDKFYNGKCVSCSYMHRKLFEMVKKEMNSNFYHPKSYVKVFKLTRKIAEIIVKEKEL